MKPLANFYETPKINTKADKQQLKRVMSILNDLHIAAPTDERLRGLKTMGLYTFEVLGMTGAGNGDLRKWARGGQPTVEQANLLYGACTISSWLLRKHYETQPVIDTLREYRPELDGSTIIRSFAVDSQRATELVHGLVWLPKDLELAEAA
jgi:hypothetical protein